MANSKQNKIKSFEDLRCWKIARELRREILLLTKNFPDIEKYRLSQQLVNSVRSVAANIAEGYGRFHYQENIQFCRIARGSLYETLDHLIAAQDENYINENELNELKNKVMDCAMILNGYINYLSAAKKDRGSHLAEEEKVEYGLTEYIESPLTNND